MLLISQHSFCLFFHCCFSLFNTQIIIFFLLLFCAANRTGKSEAKVRSQLTCIPVVCLQLTFNKWGDSNRQVSTFSWIGGPGCPACGGAAGEQEEITKLGTTVSCCRLAWGKGQTPQLCLLITSGILNAAFPEMNKQSLKASQLSLEVRLTYYYLSPPLTVQLFGGLGMGIMHKPNYI